MTIDTRAGRLAPDGGRTRWDRWVSRYDRSAARGRVAAMIAFSAATTAIVVAAWLS